MNRLGRGNPAKPCQKELNIGTQRGFLAGKIALCQSGPRPQGNRIKDAIRKHVGFARARLQRRAENTGLNCVLKGHGFSRAVSAT
jgi:hypothetical protein